MKTSNRGDAHIFLLENDEVGLDASVTSRERAASNFVSRHGLPGYSDLRPAFAFDVFHAKEHPVFRAGCLIGGRHRTHLGFLRLFTRRFSFSRGGTLLLCWRVVLLGLGSVGIVTGGTLPAALARRDRRLALGFQILYQRG